MTVRADGRLDGRRFKLSTSSMASGAGRVSLASGWGRVSKKKINFNTGQRLLGSLFLISNSEN